MQALTAFLAALAFAPSPVLATPPERTLPVDPIELLAGRETTGKPELAVTHEGIEYRFTTLENKAAFEKEPARYEVADGGACGRMGPLSGLGDARRYAVHANRIYFFASDGCRSGFLKDPAAHIEIPDDKIFGSDAKVQQGRAALDKCVVWAGGADKLRAVTSFRAAAERTETQGGKDWLVTNEAMIAFPASYYQKEAWNESWFSTASGPTGGSMATRKGKERIADSRTRAFNRSMARWPIVILKAHGDGSPQADCPGLIVIHDGEGQLDTTPVEYVKVWLNGAASRLTIDKATGKLLQLAFRGRDGTMKVGDSVRSYTTCTTVEGITLPTAYTVHFDGKSLAAAASRFDRVELNTTPDAGLFAAPNW